jgi:hypothetical protein
VKVMEQDQTERSEIKVKNPRLAAMALVAILRDYLEDEQGITAMNSQDWIVLENKFEHYFLEGIDD